AYDGALAPSAPGRDRGRRQWLIHLAEARLYARVLDEAQQYVVHALKVFGLRRPAPVAPDDLARKAARAEDLVADHFGVVAGLGIDVQHQRAVLGQQLSADRDAVTQGLQIRRHALPVIIEGWRRRAQDLAARLAAARHSNVRLPGEEGRIQIGEG